MIAESDIDALYASRNIPYTRKEVEEYVLKPEGRILALLERIHYHNHALIKHIEDWRQYYAGRGRKPSDDLPQLLMPGRNEENQARSFLEKLTDFYSHYRHGGTPRCAVFPYMVKSSISLIAALRDFHETESLRSAQRHFCGMTDLIAYHGEPQMLQDDFVGEMVANRDAFIADCQENAAHLGVWLSSGGPELAAKNAASQPPKDLLARQDEVRLRAVALMKAYRRENDSTWTQAEETIRQAIWKEFSELGLKFAPNNFHQLRYAARFRDEPAAAPETLHRALGNGE